MSVATSTRHSCYRCAPQDVPVPDAADLDSLATTAAEDGSAVFCASGYSAREIAQRHARETGGRVYVNSVSRNVRRRELTVPVAYAVATGPVYTVRGPDQWHATVYRAYWPPL